MRNNTSSQVVSLLTLSCPRSHTLHSCCRQVFYFTTTHATKLLAYCSYLKVLLFWTENLGWSWKTIQVVFASRVNFKHVWTIYTRIQSPRESTTPIKKLFFLMRKQHSYQQHAKGRDPKTEDYFITVSPLQNIFNARFSISQVKSTQVWCTYAVKDLY